MGKHICIAYTGGTIGMKPSKEGWRPAPGYLAERMASMPELAGSGMPSYDVHEFETLQDSAEMTPRHWLEIARCIDRHYFSGYDGFVVLHGTDTMAYTASALAMLIESQGQAVPEGNERQRFSLAGALRSQSSPSILPST